MKAQARMETWQLNDDEIDNYVLEYMGLGHCPNIKFISSTAIQACLSKEYSGKYDQCENNNLIFRNLKISESFDKSTYDAVFIVCHGPNIEKSKRQYNFHWSLLCYFSFTKHFYHYDSVLGMNERRAIEIVTMLMKRDVVPATTRLFQPKFICQQKSSWECGYYVILFINTILHKDW